jgi:uncharacterized protein YukE
MNGPSVHGAAAKLENALKAFRTTFSAVDQQWTDVARRDFEETYLAPMEPHIHQMIAVIGRLAAVVASANSECGSDYGSSNE